ncbi:hypothetical protein FGB62_112g10 [Gracilaria domingensis]|nr:hypothetical protein FGB62_112g10 [Gracilaria domingensis]
MKQTSSLTSEQTAYHVWLDTVMDTSLFGATELSEEDVFGHGGAVSNRAMRAGGSGSAIWGGWLEHSAIVDVHRGGGDLHHAARRRCRAAERAARRHAGPRCAALGG